MEPLRSQKITTLHSDYTIEQVDKHQELKRKRRGLYRRLSFIAVIALFVSYIMGSVLAAQAELTNQIKTKKLELQEQYASLQKQEKNLRAEIVKLNDEEYVGKLARNEYFLSNEGEIIFKLPSD